EEGIKPFFFFFYVLISEAIKEENELAVDQGAWVVKSGKEAAVVANSAAAKAGIKENDIILSINNQVIDQDHSLAGILKNFNPGDVVKMKVLSGEDEKEIAVTLGESK
ncbi:MAG: PDZ domain-containing protein, partial [Candidatus Doudnabacteria bacterium]|nr:PDZ domain-containing protein [Candidatus Doudnabacteria bacterium]